MEIIEALNKIFRSVFSDPDINLNYQTNARDIEGWDSLTHVELISTIETEFNIRFTFKEVMNFENIGDLISAIKNHLEILS